MVLGLPAAAARAAEPRELREAVPRRTGAEAVATSCHELVSVGGCPRRAVQAALGLSRSDRCVLQIE